MFANFVELFMSSAKNISLMDESPALAVIVCSVDPGRAAALERSFRAMAGAGLEFHVFDNRRLCWPIAKVYNHCASQARAACLLFVHEDVAIRTDGWAPALVAWLTRPDCGVIGFAGSALWVPTPDAWWHVPQQYHRCSYAQSVNGVESRHILPEGADVDFLPVVAIDGMAMAVRRDVWERFPFDESVLGGFHCYDIDFSVAIGRHYVNYIAYGINICHFSEGKYDRAWFDATENIYRHKWRDLSPVMVDGLTPVPDIAEVTDRSHYSYVFRKIRTDASDTEVRTALTEYARQSPLRGAHLARVLKLRWQYLLKRGL